VTLSRKILAAVIALLLPAAAMAPAHATSSVKKPHHSSHSGHASHKSHGTKAAPAG
jgi:hypothetical protein